MNHQVSIALRQTYGFGACMLASLILSPAAALLIFHNDMFTDPIDVVGNPIVSGYTESSEQIAWGVFWASSIAVSMLASGLETYIYRRIMIMRTTLVIVSMFLAFLFIKHAASASMLLACVSTISAMSAFQFRDASGTCIRRRRSVELLLGQLF